MKLYPEDKQFMKENNIRFTGLLIRDLQEYKIMSSFNNIPQDFKLFDQVYPQVDRIIEERNQTTSHSEEQPENILLSEHQKILKVIIQAIFKGAENIPELDFEDMMLVRRVKYFYTEWILKILRVDLLRDSICNFLYNYPMNLVSDIKTSIFKAKYELGEDLFYDSDISKRIVITHLHKLCQDTKGIILTRIGIEFTKGEIEEVRKFMDAMYGIDFSSMIQFFRRKYVMNSDTILKLNGLTEGIFFNLKLELMKKRWNFSRNSIDSMRLVNGDVERLPYLKKYLDYLKL